MFFSPIFTFLLWANLLFKFTIITAHIPKNTRHQNKLHQIQSQMMDMPVHHHHHQQEADIEPEVVKDPESEEIPGDPLGPKHSLEFGAKCVKANPQACQHFPEVTCVWVEETTFLCRCDFQHNWNNVTKQCVGNVFAPCAETTEEFDCGLNMECRQDTIGSNPNEKMCRCKKRYKADIDDEGLPSRCILDDNYVDDEMINRMASLNQGLSVKADGFTGMVLCFLALQNMNVQLI